VIALATVLPGLALQTRALEIPRQPAIIAVGLLYFVGVALIGAWAARRTRTARDFYVAGEGIGVWVMAISAMAATLSGFAFIGGPALVYALGLGAVFIVLPISITNTLGAWVLAKRLRLLGAARGCITIPDAIAARVVSGEAAGIEAEGNALRGVGEAA
jgi:Na+/proline symporter